MKQAHATGVGQHHPELLESEHEDSHKMTAPKPGKITESTQPGHDQFHSSLPPSSKSLGGGGQSISHPSSTSVSRSSYRITSVPWRVSTTSSIGPVSVVRSPKATASRGAVGDGTLWS